MATNGGKAVHYTITQADDGRPKPPKFTDKYKEREYVKFRLAQAFRVFGQLQETRNYCFSDNILIGNLGYDERVAGHITARVSTEASLGILHMQYSLQDPIKAGCFWVNPFVCEVYNLLITKNLRLHRACTSN